MARGKEQSLRCKRQRERGKWEKAKVKGKEEKGKM